MSRLTAKALVLAIALSCGNWNFAVEESPGTADDSLRGTRALSACSHPRFGLVVVIYLAARVFFQRPRTQRVGPLELVGRLPFLPKRGGVPGSCEPGAWNLDSASLKLALGTS
jgi:hypothetical protein